MATKSKKTSREKNTVPLSIGDEAPDFVMKSDADETIRLSDYRGKKIVLYFYPKDDTPGCTAEACSFRDGFSEIERKGAVVFGVSTDSVESHKKFKEKYHLNFPLLSDVEKKVVNAYGVWKEKNMYGKKYMGIERTTFIIDELGKIKKIFPKVKVDGHLEEVLAEL
jgi:peroxiredoxin Q/BCP